MQHNQQSRKVSWVARRVAELEARKSSISTIDASCTTKPAEPADVKSMAQQQHHQHRRRESNHQDIKTRASRSRPVKSGKVTIPIASESHSSTCDQTEIDELEAAVAASQSWNIYVCGADTADIRKTTGMAAGVAVARNRPSIDPNRNSVASSRVADRQIRGALHEAEKRGDWLREELNMVSACAAKQVRELKHELRCAQQKNRFVVAAAAGAIASNCEENGNGTATAFSSKDAAPPDVGEPKEINEKLCETTEALKSLRKKFFRMLREKDRLECKYDRLRQRVPTNRTSETPQRYQQSSPLVPPPPPPPSPWQRRQHQRQRARGSSAKDAGEKVRRALITPNDETTLGISATAEASTQGVPSRPCRSPRTSNEDKICRNNDRGEWRWPPHKDAPAPAWGKS